MSNAHQFWRLNFTSGYSGYVSLAQVEYRNIDGVRVSVPTSSGSLATASSIFSGTYPASNAFNNSAGTFWNSSSSYPHWLKYDTNGLDIIDVFTVAIKIRDGYSSEQAPSVFTLEMSDDDVEWIEVLSVTGATWINGEFNLYEIDRPFKYKIAGTVLVNEVPEKRWINIYKRTDGSWVTGGYSDPVTGKYEFRMTNNQIYYAVILEDETEQIYNSQVRDFIIPTEIQGD